MPSTDVFLKRKNFGDTITSALNEFYEALTKRWREEVCESAILGKHDYPVVIRRPVSPHSHQPLWEYWTRPAREHLRFPGQCAFVTWVEAGQNGPLSAVTCDGATGVEAGREVVVPDGNGDMVVVPPYIECGMGQVLRLVEDWAWGEREHLFYRIPLFDSHDLFAIESAHDTLIEIGRRLALEADDGSYHEYLAADFASASADDLREITASLGGENSVGLHWWAGWTGLAASRAKSNFFDSVVPTIQNQAGIAGSLANLYSDRAAIIYSARNNALNLIQSATEALGEKVTTPRAEYWQTVQNIGAGITTAAGWYPKGAAVGAAVFLTGFLMKNLDQGHHTVGYRHGVAEVVSQLNDELDALTETVQANEREYGRAAARLAGKVFNIHSFELELYDLTRNDADGDRHERGYSASGFNADVEHILRIAEGCYQAGNRYEALVPMIADVSQADPDLADQDGRPTEGDKIVLEQRTHLEGYLKTTCGRYLLAGDQVRQAAEEYVSEDESQRVAFEATMEDWDDPGMGYDSSLDPQEAAAATDRRGYDPWEGHPARAGAEPGASSPVAPGSGTDVEYVVEE